MDARVMDCINQLAAALANVDSEKDRDTLVAAHGILNFMAHEIERRVPELAKPQRLLDSIRERIAHGEPFGRRLDDGIEPAENALFPVRPKPGPKGLRGGAAAPLT